MTKVKFSILTTVYNKEDFLAQAIQSVLGQSYHDFELVIVDDGSSDESWCIAEKFASEDSRVRIFRNECNLGDYPNRNKAMSLAENEYLKFLDADDVMAPGTLETYAKAVSNVAGDEPLYYVNCPSVEVKSARLLCLDSEQAYRRAYVDRKRLFEAAPNSCLYRKSVLNQYGMFQIQRQTGDYEMAHRLALHGTVGVLETSEYLSEWRCHPNQESQQIRTDLSVTSDYMRISRSYLAQVQEYFSASELKAVYSRQRHVEAQLFRSALGRLDFRAVIKIKKNLNHKVLQLLPFIFRPYDINE